MVRANRGGIRSEAGFALASAMLLGAVILLLTAVVVVRGTSQSQIQVNDARWEQAVFVAEGSLDAHLADLMKDPDPDAVTTGHVEAQFGDKAEIIALANSYADANPSAVLSLPDGEAVVLKPSDDRKIYAVGWVPAREPGAKTRVVEVSYDFTIARFPGWTANHAFLTGGEAELDSGSSGVYDPSGSAAAHVHANGGLSVHQNFTLQGCATSAASGSTQGVNCPPSSTVETELVPDVDPQRMHDTAHYDLCPDGLIRAGPAHASGTPSAEPCTGPVVSLSGWTSSLKQGVRTWSAGTEPAATYYVHEGDIDGQFGGNVGPRAITLVAASIGNVRDCTGASSSGNIFLSSGTWLTGAPNSSGLTLVAGGDVLFRGNATVEGLTMAHEQIDFRGGTGNGGAVVAESACDHPASPVTGASGISGGTGITWAGSISTPFEGYSDDMSLMVAGRRER